MRRVVLTARIAILLGALTLLAAPNRASAAELGLALGSSTTWHLTDAARRIGQTTEGGFALAASVGNDRWRVQGLHRAEWSESWYGSWRTSDTDIFGLGVGRRLVDRDWLRVEARGALLLAHRELNIDDGRSFSGKAWAPGFEASGAVEFLLPRRATRDRFRLGVRLELGWHQILGGATKLKPTSTVTAGAEVDAIELGAWHEAGPLLRSGVVLRF